MVPCRLTGKPFWEIYVNQNPPLWKAYYDAVRYYGIDGWFGYGNVKLKTKHNIEVETKILSRSPEKYEVMNIIHTPGGDMREVMVSSRDNPPVFVEKMVKDFREDFNKYKYFFGEITGYDHPDLFGELVELHEKYCLRKLEMYIDAGIECIFTSGSGSITLQSPDIWRMPLKHLNRKTGVHGFTWR